MKKLMYVYLIGLLLTVSACTTRAPQNNDSNKSWTAAYGVKGN